MTVHQLFPKFSLCSLLLLAVVAGAANVSRAAADTDTDTVSDALEFKTEQIVEKTDDGQLEREYTVRVYSDGKREQHGSFVEYHDNGKVYLRGAYAHDKRVDGWQYFDAKGNLVKEGQYRIGLLHGEWNIYQNGKRLRVETYRDGLRHGRWMRYSPVSERVLGIREFVDGELHGTVSLSYPDGKRKQHLQFRGGKLHGEQHAWHANGKNAEFGEYVDGKRHGVYKVWSQQGVLQVDVKYANGAQIYGADSR